MGALDPTTVALVAVGGASGLVALITAVSTFLRDRFKFSKSEDDESDNLKAVTVTVTDKEGNVIITLQSPEDDRVERVIKEIAAIRETKDIQTEDIQGDSHPDQAPRAMVDLGDLEREQGNPDQARHWYEQAIATSHPGSSAEGPLSDVRLLTVTEVATIMRVTKMTVYKLVHSGELEVIRKGRSFRIPETAVNNYLKQVDVFNRPRR